MLLLMIGAFRGDRSYAALTWVSVAFYAAAGAAVLLPGAQGRAFSALMVADDFSAFLKVLIAAAAAVAALLALPYLKPLAHRAVRVSGHPDAVRQPVCLSWCRRTT